MLYPLSYERRLVISSSSRWSANAWKTPILPARDGGDSVGAGLKDQAPKRRLLGRPGTRGHKIENIGAPLDDLTANARHAVLQPQARQPQARQPRALELTGNHPEQAASILEHSGLRAVDLDHGRDPRRPTAQSAVPPVRVHDRTPSSLGLLVSGEA
jgi:hypothetical protein